MEEEIPFFTKSKEKFTTGTIEAWGMLRRHHAALVELSRRDASHTTYCKLWYYEKRLERMIKDLEKIPCLLVIREEENRLPLDGSIDYEPVKSTQTCKMNETEEETVGTYLRSMRQSSSPASSSGE